MRKTKGDARAQALVKEQQPSTRPKTASPKLFYRWTDSRTRAGSPRAETQTGPFPSPSPGITRSRSLLGLCCAQQRLGRNSLRRMKHSTKWKFLILISFAFFLISFWDNLGSYYRLNIWDDRTQMASIYFWIPVPDLRDLYTATGSQAKLLTMVGIFLL